MVHALIFLSAIVVVVSTFAFGGYGSPAVFSNPGTIKGFCGPGVVAGPKRFGDGVRYSDETPQPAYRNGPPEPGFAFYRSSSRSYGDVIPKRSFRKGTPKPAYFRGNGDTTLKPKPTDRSITATAHPSVRYAALSAARAAYDLGNGAASRRVATYASKVVADAAGDNLSRRAADTIGAEAADAATANPAVLKAAYEAARAAIVGGENAASRRATAARAAQETSGHQMSRSAAGVLGAEAADKATADEISTAQWKVFAKAIPNNKE